MAVFQGENLLFSIILKDNDGVAIPTSEINDIVATLYLEYNDKPYFHFGLDPDPNIPVDTEGLYDRNPIWTIPVSGVTSPITAIPEDDAFSFAITSTQTNALKPGRYIIQITYNTTNGSFTDNKNSIQKGALLSISKGV